MWYVPVYFKALYGTIKDTTLATNQLTKASLPGLMDGKYLWRLEQWITSPEIKAEKINSSLAQEIPSAMTLTDDELIQYILPKIPQESQMYEYNLKYQYGLISTYKDYDIITIYLTTLHDPCKLDPFKMASYIFKEKLESGYFHLTTKVQTKILVYKEKKNYKIKLLFYSDNNTIIEKSTFAWIDVQSENFIGVLNMDKINQTHILKYFPDIINCESAYYNSVYDLIKRVNMVIKNPILLGLISGGYKNLAKNITTYSSKGDYKSRFNYYFGYYDPKAKTIYTALDVNKYQLQCVEKYLINQHGNTDRYSYYDKCHCFIKCIRLFLPNTKISSLSNETTDYYIKMVDTMHEANINMTDMLDPNVRYWWSNSPLYAVPIEKRIKYLISFYKIAKGDSADLRLIMDTSNLYNSYKSRLNQVYINLGAPTLPENFDILELNKMSDWRRWHDTLINFDTTLTNIQNAQYRKQEAERLEQLQKAWLKIKKDRQQYQYEDDNYIIKFPDDPSEISTEGALLSHCVGGYKERVMAGSTNIFFLRKKSEPEKPFYTIEMYNNQIIQCHGYCNKWIGNDPEAIPTFYKWIKKNNFYCQNNILLSTATGYSDNGEYLDKSILENIKVD